MASGPWFEEADDEEDEDEEEEDEEEEEGSTEGVRLGLETASPLIKEEKKGRYGAWLLEEAGAGWLGG